MLIDYLWLDKRDEEDLRWWCDDSIRGDAGARSVMGSMIDRMTLGARSGRSSHPHMVAVKGTTPSLQNYGISDFAYHAVERERRVNAHLSQCSPDQRHLLRTAFTTRALPRSLEVLCEFPGALLACCRVMEVYKQAGGLHLDQLGTWLDELVSDYYVGDGPASACSAALIQEIRPAVTADLLEALLAYGARVKGLAFPPTISLVALARVAGISDKTIKLELTRDGVRVGSFRRGQSAMVTTDALRARWRRWSKVAGKLALEPVMAAETRAG